MILVHLWACAPDLAAEHVWDDGLGEDPFAGLDPTERILLTLDGDTTHARVDAQDASIWVELDLDGDGSWDLRASRFHLSTHSGISGAGGVEARFVEDGEPGPVRVDEVDGDDEDSDPDYALSTWYAYDETTHILTPREGVWWIRTTAADDVELVIESYYDEWGTSARFALSWRAR